MSSYDNGLSLEWQNNFHVTTTVNISKLKFLRAGGSNCGLNGPLPFKDKFSFFLHLIANDVVSFCWLLLIKEEKMKTRGGKIIIISFCQIQLTWFFLFKYLILFIFI